MKHTSTVSLNLLAAAQIIAERGLAKRTFGTRDNGPRCILGAIAEVRGMNLGELYLPCDTIAITPEGQQVAKQIGESALHIPAWNDAHSQEEVVELLQRAAQ